MPHGYNGRILHVDLNQGSLTVEEPPKSFYRKYMGGGLLASYYMLKEIAPGCDPLGPDNVLIFAASVMTGAPFSGMSRYTVAAKSPLTGGFGESEAGGYFGPEMKFAGFDAVVIKGESAKPCYLWLHHGEAELRDAGGVWGLTNGETRDKLVEELGDSKIRIASIGKAGENQISMACVINELAHANGRTGMGAVMGSKNLKAVVARGDSKSLEFADPEEVKALSKWHVKAIKDHPGHQAFNAHGTSMLVEAVNGGGMLPTRNWQQSVFEDTAKINAAALEADLLKRPGTCYRCAVACKRIVEHKSERFDIEARYGGPEYETLASFGSLCGVSDIAAICKAHEICNAHGMDTISAGSAIAFAMECWEKGILEPEDGRRVTFGDADGMLWLLEKIAGREGIGGVLCLGVKKAAGIIGNGAEEYALHIKGQEIAMHDPRGKTGVAFGMALSPTGADHIESPHELALAGEGVRLAHPLGIVDPVDLRATDARKVGVFRKLQLTFTMNNTLGLCNFVTGPVFSLSYQKIVEALRAVTGWNTSLYEVLNACERAQCMSRIFNNREGFGPKDDRLFKRLHIPSPKGPLEGETIDEAEFRSSLDAYYQMAGWDSEGRPTPAKLADLELEWLIEA